MMSTLSPGALVVRSAYPDPPFDLMQDGLRTGFDVELMRAACRELGLELQPVAYSGDDFNGIFDGLVNRSCDAVISGTTITPERASVVLFSQPYLEFNQGIAVNRHLSPNVTSPADLRGLTAGIQIGNTSDAVAKRLLAQGEIAGIRYYPYHGIPAALDDLSAGRIGMIIKLFPVISWLVEDRPELERRDAGSDPREARHSVRAGSRGSPRRGRCGDLKITRERRIRPTAVALARPRGDNVRRFDDACIQTQPADNGSHVIEGTSGSTPAPTSLPCTSRSRRRVLRSTGTMRRRRNTC